MNRMVSRIRGALAGRRATVVRAFAVAAVAVIGVATTPNIVSLLSLRSMFVVASFLGIVAIGQTLCVLLGEIDLSIAFLIGAADLGTLWLIDKGLASGAAAIIMLAVCLAAGAVNGFVGHLVKGQSVVVTLGIGYLVLGLVQAVTSIGSSGSGTVYGKVPSWIDAVASVRGKLFGIPFPPAILLWAVVAVAAGVWLRRSWLGRGMYALGGNPVAASRLLVPDRTIRMVAFAMSGLMAGVVGIMLLGFGGGAVADVGSPYLFMTVAAVAVGGTSLAGGYGGVGFTVVGVVILSVLNVVLVGSGLSNAVEQLILGLLIVPAVAAYGRAPHPRTRV